MWFVSAVVTVGEEFWLVGLKFSEDLVSVKTGGKVLVEFLALLILHHANDSVVVSALDQHSFIWNACQLVIDLQL